MEALKKYGPILLGVLYNGLVQYQPDLVALNPRWAAAVSLAIIVLAQLAPQPQKPTPPKP